VTWLQISAGYRGRKKKNAQRLQPHHESAKMNRRKAPSRKRHAQRARTQSEISAKEGVERITFKTVGKNYNRRQMGRVISNTAIGGKRDENGKRYLRGGEEHRAPKALVDPKPQNKDTQIRLKIERKGKNFQVNRVTKIAARNLFSEGKDPWGEGHNKKRIS